MDIRDVLDTLAGAVGQVVYPSGTDSASIADTPVVIYPGWPGPCLDSDLALGKLHVSLWAMAGERNTSRYPMNWQDQSAGHVARELKRQTCGVMITVWAPSPTPRDLVAAAIDVYLAANQRMTGPDGFQLWSKYRSTILDDASQKAGLYRRDIIYDVEYPTTQAMAVPVVVQITTDVRDQYDDTITTIVTE